MDDHELDDEEFVQEVEDTYAHELVCPYCLSEQSDSWELGCRGENEGTTECNSCSREVKWIREITVNYIGCPVDNKE